jgi:Ca-activated chloride channel family protein
VSFLAGWRLVFLVAPLLLLVAYVLAQRARQKAAVRFTSVEMLASVAPRRPGWQRHVAAVVLLAAVAVLVVGFARPLAASRVPRRHATVMLALDTSGSMISTDVAPNRLAAAQQAARNFVRALPPGVQLGLVMFSSGASVLVSPTSNRAAVLSAIDSLQATGATATGAAIDVSLNAISVLPVAGNGRRAPAAIVLMSDGNPTVGQGNLSPTAAVDAAALKAKAAGVPISTIAFGTETGTVDIQGRIVAVPSDPAAMAKIASESGGQTFTAETAGQLQSVYQQIGRVVGYQIHRHEVTAVFTGVALALVLLAAVAALAWNQRIL